MLCPICKKVVDEDPPPRTFPFCSERCKLIDFGAWANGEYAVPAEESAPSLEELEQSPDGGDDDSTRAPRR